MTDRIIGPRTVDALVEQRQPRTLVTADGAPAVEAQAGARPSGASGRLPTGQVDSEAPHRRATPRVRPTSSRASVRSAGTVAAASQSPQNGTSAVSICRISLAAVAALRGFVLGTYAGGGGRHLRLGGSAGGWSAGRAGSGDVAAPGSGVPARRRSADPAPAGSRRSPRAAVGPSPARPGRRAPAASGPWPGRRRPWRRWDRGGRRRGRRTSGWP